MATIPPEAFKNKKYIEYMINNNDCGSSAKTIICHILKLDNDWNSPPYDPSDFGRCYRMLREFPELREKLNNMKTLNTTWHCLVMVWSVLEDIFERDEDSGKSSDLYLILKTLTKDK